MPKPRENDRLVRLIFLLGKSRTSRGPIRRKTLFPFGHETRRGTVQLGRCHLGNCRPRNAIRNTGVRDRVALANWTPISEAVPPSVRNVKQPGMYETYLALVRGLLAWDLGDWPCFDSSVERLEDGVCVLFGC